MLADGVKPDIAAVRDTSDGRSEREGSRAIARVLFHTGQAATARTITTTPAAMRPSERGSNEKPALGSALRARPIGISVDAKNAPSTPTAAAATPISATRPMPASHNCQRVMPRASSVGVSVASSVAWRASSCEKIRDAMSAISAATIHSATASRWIDR